MQILPAIPALVVMIWTLWYARRNPVFGFAIFFIIFSFTWRLFSAAFLDIFGPVYAIELFDVVGGNGGSVLFAATLLGTLLVFASVLRVSKLRPAVGPRLDPVPRSAITLGSVVYVITVVFVCLLYADFFRRGVIPLFEGMERGEYTRDFGGPLHKWFLDFGNFLAFGFGILTIFPRFRGGSVDLRFVGILIALYTYCLLAGHRFSIFFSMTTFFLLPRAALYLPHPESIAAARTDGFFRRLLVSRTARWLLIVLLVAAVIGALVNSYLNTRGFAPGLALLSVAQRIFIQPSELWFLTYERVVLNGNYDPIGASVFVFLDPIDPTRSTSMQYLMAQALGESTATSILDSGTTYNGGYPEIFFELLGPFLAWPAILGVSLVSAYLIREVLLSICQGRLLTAFAVMYVFYAFLLTFGGGMLNFLVAVTFWIKVTFMVFCLLIEKRARGVTRPILPWVVWQPPGTVAPPRS